MAGEELPPLYNFFGSSVNDRNQEQHTENPANRSLLLTEKIGHDPSASVLDESRIAPDSHSRDSSSKSLEMDTDALDGLRLYKKLRVERSDENKKGHEEAAMDDLSLTMQPPRLLPSNLQPSVLTQTEFSKVNSKHWDCNMPPLLGTYGPGRASQKGLFADHIGMSTMKDSTAASLMHIPPADEGSRTGLKGSSVGSLLNRAMSGGPVLSLGQSKSSSRGAGSESTFLASQETTPITRQLTIFYGGQAHVFEDVSFDKAEAIMALAGSTGRSWSTVYSPQPKSSMALSVTEGSLSTHDRDKAKGGSKPTSTNYGDSSGFSTEVRNALSSLLHKGHRQTADACVQEQSSHFAKWATDMQKIADHVGKKAESKTQVSIKAADLEKEHDRKN